MAGCNECKHYKSELGEFVDGKFGPMKRQCLLGKNEEMKDWWEENGTKTEVLTDMPCHDYHDATKSLIKMNKLADEMLSLLRITPC